MYSSSKGLPSSDSEWDVNGHISLCLERLSWSKIITSIALRFVIYEDTRYVTYCNMKITIEQK